MRLLATHSERWFRTNLPVLELSSVISDSINWERPRGRIASGAVRRLPARGRIGPSGFSVTWAPRDLPNMGASLLTMDGRWIETAGGTLIRTRTRANLGGFFASGIAGLTIGILLYFVLILPVITSFSMGEINDVFGYAGLLLPIGGVVITVRAHYRRLVSATEQDHLGEAVKSAFYAEEIALVPDELSAQTALRADGHSTRL